MNEKIKEEVWKGLIYQGNDYSNRLEISNIGRLRNAKNKNIYKMCISHYGYYQVSVSLGSKKNKKVFRIHKCVADTFIENPYRLPVVNHKDGDKLNNCVDNLEWVTYSENTKHAFDNNLIDKNKTSGVKNIWSKFTEEDICYIRENYKPRDKEFGSRALAKKYNVNHSAISRIVNYKRYK